MKKYRTLKELRQSLKLTQDEFSKLTKVRRPTITDIENDKGGSIGIYKKIAKACKCEFDYYFISQKKSKK